MNKNSLGATKGISRTIAFVKDNAELWLASGGNEKNAKNFFNCIHHPLLYGKEGSKIIERCPPPSLHLFLGLVNSVFNSIAQKDPIIVNLRSESANVSRHDQFGFTGRHCRNLLAKRSVLQTIELMPYFQVLEHLENMFDSCFGLNLKDGYQVAVNKFCESWLLANLPVTPKFHIIKHHIIEFCEATNEGLAKYSEQTIEAIHSDFSATWQNYKVPEKHKNYPHKLLNAIVSYNSGHVL